MRRVKAAVEGIGLCLGGIDRGLHLCVGEPIVGAYVDASARCDGSDRVLRLERVSHLPYGKGVERSAKSPGNLRCDYDAPSGQADDDGTLGPFVEKCLSESSPCVGAIVETDRLLRCHGSMVADRPHACIGPVPDPRCGKPRIGFRRFPRLRASARVVRLRRTQTANATLRVADEEEAMNGNRLEGQAYWLAHCEGFRVDAPGGQLGRVEAVISRDGREGADALVVRGGMLGGRLVVVPADEVARIMPRKERIALRASPQVGGTEFLSEILARARDRGRSVAA